MATVYKRGEVWWGRAQRDGREFRRSLRTGTKAVALKRLATWVAELEASAWGERPRKTFTDAAVIFATTHLEQVKKSSARRYRVSVDALAPKFGGMFLDEIDTEKWAEYCADRIGRGATGATINRDRACLSKIFAVAVQAKMVTQNPVEGFMRYRETEGRTRFLTKDEYKDLLDAATPGMRPVIVVAVNTGMRLGEIISLTWPQVDLVRKEIRIDETKSGEPRTIPMAGDVPAQVRAQPKRKDDPRVFALSDSEKYATETVSQRFARIAEKAGIPDVRFHDLRHTFASWATKGMHSWQKSPMRRERLQLWLGHKSPQMTARYSHLDTTDLHSEVEE